MSVESRKYRSKPGVKEREREYSKKYRSKPEVKEMRRRYARRYIGTEKYEDKKKKWLEYLKEEYSPCRHFIKEHHERMKDDPEHLTTKFLINITGCKCKRSERK
jgi:hypothetical protein